MTETIAMYRGFFLNLQRNEQRRAALVSHLEAIGAEKRYERFEAVEGKTVAAEHPTKLDPGNLGLWLSHERLLADVGRDQHVHILEDDAFLARDAVKVIAATLAHIDEKIPTWDLLFTDTFVQAQTGVFHQFLMKMREFVTSGTFTVLNLASIPFACTTSMLINKASIDKYLDVMKGNWKVGRPIDIFIRQQVVKGNLNAYVTVPFITTLSADSSNSDIRGDMDRSRRIYDTLRRGFFKEANMVELQKDMQKLIAGAKISPLIALYLNAEMFTLSDQFESF
jgi:GR25 family glycosyltransferase involved in LPS biosynthesis